MHFLTSTRFPSGQVLCLGSALQCEDGRTAVIHAGLHIYTAGIMRSDIAPARWTELWRPLLVSMRQEVSYGLLSLQYTIFISSQYDILFPTANTISLKKLPVFMGG